MNRAVICCVILACAAGCSSTQTVKNDASAFHPLVRQLLESPPVYSDCWDRDGTPFFESLFALLESHGKSLEEYARYGTDSGCVHKIICDAKTHIVVILGIDGRTIPGTSAQHLILIGADGQLLDKLACCINSRYGYIDVDVKTPCDSDEAQIVMVFEPRYKGGSRWHNWHEITYGEKTFEFREELWKEDPIWTEKGLCRIRVANDRFVILFPELKEK